MFETADLPDASDCDVAVLTRPNNPDGRMVDAGDMAALALAMARKGGTLVVDEALPILSPVPRWRRRFRRHDRAAVFGKFYGLPGLRLGFVVSDPATAAALVAALELGRYLRWLPISVPRHWRTRAGRRRRGTNCGARRPAWTACLRVRDWKFSAALDLFRLAALDDAASIHQRLGRAGLYIRRFPENPGLLRFGLPVTKPIGIASRRH